MTELSARETLSEYEVKLTLDFPPSLQRLIEANLAVGIEVYDIESGLLERRDWLDYTNIDLPNDGLTIDTADTSGVQVQAIKPLLLKEGVYRLHLFLGEDHFNQTEHSGEPRSISCPLPFHLRSPLTERKYDLALASWSGQVGRDLELTLSFTTQTCGPGEFQTAISGEIEPPPLDDSAVLERLMVHLTPQNPLESDNLINDELGSDPLIPLTIPLQRHMWWSEDKQRLFFHINQLPIGNYQLRIFIDSDGDALPTPCDRELGFGGDQWVSSRSIELILGRGELIQLSDSIQLTEVLDCREEGSTFEIYYGQVSMNDTLKTALRFSEDQRLVFSDKRRTLSPHHFHRGRPLLTLQKAIISAGRFSIHRDLSPLQISESADSELSIWVDEGGDLHLIPCDDSAGLGQDIWWWSGDWDRLTRAREEIISLEEPIVPLDLAQRCEAPDALLTLEISLNFVWPEVSSKRPLVLVYEDILSGQINETVLTDIGSNELENSLRLQRRIRPGAYLLSAYVDQDLNGAFTSCTEDRLGDRFSTSRSTIVSLEDHETENVSLSITPRDCPILRSSPQLNLISTVNGAPLALNDLEDDPTRLEELALCEPSEVYIKHSDIDPLSDEALEQSIANYEACLPLNSESIELQSAPSGKFTLKVCAPLSDRVDLSNTLDQPTFEDCDRPSFWRGEIDFILNAVPRQSIELYVSPSCYCD